MWFVGRHKSDRLLSDDLAAWREDMVASVGTKAQTEGKQQIWELYIIQWHQIDLRQRGVSTVV